jgi:hypothetical protein
VFCNGQEKCRFFACVAGDPPAVPDDGVDCTVDRCDEGTRRIVHERDDGACEDDDQCTKDTCDASVGCVHMQHTGACDDGVACTKNDRCIDGECEGQPDCPDHGTCNLETGLCEPKAEDGCSVNFWKGNLADWAPTTLAADQSFDDVFDLAAFEPDITLIDALNLDNAFKPGGDPVAAKIEPALARQAVAALLNARYPDLNFPLSKEDVRNLVRRVAAGQTSSQDALETLLHANALGCPLGEDARVGDANKDGVITASDALMTLRAAVGSDTCAPEICDVDGNGTITAADALEVLRAAVGMEQL